MINIFRKKQNRFICIQFVLEEQKINNLNNGNIETTNIFNDITRIVDADTEEEAIGKFILETRDINVIQKLDLRCYNLENLKRL